MTGPSLPQDAAQGADVLKWFYAARTNRKLDDVAPLSRWIRALDDVGANRVPMAHPLSDSIAPASSGPPSSLVVIADVYIAILAAFCVRCIEGAAAERVIDKLTIDASFVHAELGNRDDHGAGRIAMPAGVGTLLIAAYCAQVGGRRLAVYGNLSRSLDVEWTTNDGAVLRFEAKSRSFAAGFKPSGSSPMDAIKDVAGRLALAAPPLRKRSKSERVKCLNVVVATGFYPTPLLREMDALDWDPVLIDAFSKLGPYREPQAAVVHLFGLDIANSAVDPQTIRRYIPVTNARPRPDEAAERAFRLIAGDATGTG